MSRLKVRYQDKLVGGLASVPVNGRTCIFFEYAPDFLRSGINLSPLRLPFRSGLISRDGGTPNEYLPGLFEDSVPDRWGLKLLNDWFRRKGIAEHEVTPLMMLSHVGQRSMGALIYEPEDGPPEAGRIDLASVYREAVSQEAEGPQALSQVLADIGSPPGGAQPKALITLPKEGRLDACYGGSRNVPAGHEAWIVKFTPRQVPRDNIGSDGRMEEAYALMARAAGIKIPPTRLLATGRGKEERLHFAAQRFDRDGNERIHHHTLAGMTHMRGGDLDYETLLAVTRAVTRDEREVLKAFRRAVFNVLACNDDDHGRNHGFLYRAGQWRLGPAYDVTFRRLRERGLAVCGTRSGAGISNLRELAARSALDRSTVESIIDEVQSALRKWKRFAKEAGVPADYAAQVETAIRA
jgi:serine/threonine-protein kinase HipA